MEEKRPRQNRGRSYFCRSWDSPSLSDDLCRKGADTPNRHIQSIVIPTEAVTHASRGKWRDLLVAGFTAMRERVWPLDSLLSLAIPAKSFRLTILVFNYSWNESLSAGEIRPCTRLGAKWFL